MARNVPTGVKVISVLYYIGTVILAIIGLGFFFGIFGGGDNLGTIESIIEPIGYEFGGIIFIALAVLGFFIGKGLGKGKSWARIIVIVFSIIGFIFAIFIIFGVGFSRGIINLIVNGVIGGYLLFSKNVKMAFSKY